MNKKGKVKKLSHRRKKDRKILIQRKILNKKEIKKERRKERNISNEKEKVKKFWVTERKKEINKERKK